MSQQDQSRQRTADRSQGTTASAQHGSAPTSQRAGQGPQAGTSQQGTPSGSRSGTSQQRYGVTARGGAGSYGLSPFSGTAGPLSLMRRISEEMDQLLEGFGLPRSLLMDPMGNRSGVAQGTSSIWSPRIDVAERNGRLVIKADLPGVGREDVNVEILRDAVIIQGERREERERTDNGYYHSERVYGRFHRAIPLPEGADVDQANATFRDGVIEIEVPLQQERSRRLELRDSGSAGASGGASGANASGSGTSASGSSAPSASGGATATSGSSSTATR